MSHTMQHGSPHPLKAIKKFALVVLCVTEIQDNESDQNRQENSHVTSLHKGSQCLDDNASGIEARQPRFLRYAYNPMRDPGLAFLCPDVQVATIKLTFPGKRAGRTSVPRAVLVTVMLELCVMSR